MRGRRAACAAIGLLVLSVSVPRLALAQDPAGALRDLTQSPDFRVRVSAALYLGRVKPVGAREALEVALADSHPAVRVAAASALGALGDPTAITALARRLGSESSASVKAQIQASIERLRSGVAADQGGAPEAEAPRRQLGPSVRYVVRLGTMRNPTGIRGDEMRNVLHDAARSRARFLKGAAVVDADPGLMVQAAERKLPIITLDGSLLQLAESRVAGSIQVQARVEFAVSREKILKGTLSGAATTFGSSPTLSDLGRRRLQDDAVDGAVESALRGADQGLIVAGL
ncbi:MAG TPA: HEAT repeat domain-containing protein [Polyangiaceae bacterium]